MAAMNGLHLCVPLFLQITAMLVFHLVSLAISIAAIAMLSNHLPYRQNMYHCEHCSELELDVAVGA